MRDFPPGSPPIVRYMGVSANYWLVLREGQMEYMDGIKVFTDEVMKWLRQIKPDIERMLLAT